MQRSFISKTHFAVGLQREKKGGLRGGANVYINPWVLILFPRISLNNIYNV